jgi:hypothetical protein
MTTELIQLPNQPKTEVVATAISDDPTAVSGTRGTREVVAVPRTPPRKARPPTISPPLATHVSDIGPVGDALVKDLG